MIRVPDSGTPAERALRTLQIYDEIVPVAERWLVIHAQTLLGEELGLECTGTPSAFAEDGSPSPGWFDHNGDTCPIHEWLDPSDSPSISLRKEVQP